MANVYPLKITVVPEGWRLFSLRKADPAFQVFSQKVMARDQYMCQFCGFKATKFQEVVNLDNNYHNNKLANLVTSCCFCAQCFFLEAVGKDDYGGGFLIYLPEMSQGELNGLCHVLFCAMYNTTNYRTDAQESYRNLRMRAQVVEKQLGEGMSDPALFGRVLIDIPTKDRTKIAAEVLPFLRLLPAYAKFTQQISAWSRDSMEELAGEE